MINTGFVVTAVMVRVTCFPLAPSPLPVLAREYRIRSFEIARSVAISLADEFVSVLVCRSSRHGLFGIKSQQQPNPGHERSGLRVAFGRVRRDHRRQVSEGRASLSGDAPRGHWQRAQPERKTRTQARLYGTQGPGVCGACVWTARPKFPVTHNRPSKRIRFFFFGFFPFIIGPDTTLIRR